MYHVDHEILYQDISYIMIIVSQLQADYKFHIFNTAIL